jgi:hypothetical protein
MIDMTQFVFFIAKLWNNGRIPEKAHLKAAKYRYPGYAYEAFKYIFNTPDDNLYNLHILNVSHSHAYYQLCAFLNKTRVDATFPWEHKI